jgi:DNA-binding NarL/FixJ family response regulator
MLTRREEEVLSLLAEGKSNREIADTLNITRNTVKSHLTHIYSALDIHTRTQAAVTWHRAVEGTGRIRRRKAG